MEINSLKRGAGTLLPRKTRIRLRRPCVLGETTKVNLLGYENAVGKYVEGVNDTWLQVIGVLTPQATSDSDVEGVQAMNRNNLIIAPLNTVMRRFEDNTSYLKDEIDGIYAKVGAQSRFYRDRKRWCARFWRNIAQRRGRFHRSGARGTAGRAPPDIVHLRNRDDLYCRHFAAGRRHRHHEHHAGDGFGAHARNQESGARSVHGKGTLYVNS